MVRQPTEIIPGKLYIGNMKSAKFLRRFGIRYILNLSGVKVDGRRRNFPLRDSGKESPRKLEQAIQKIHRRLSSGKFPLYVHCLGGKSRSVVVTALYLYFFGNDFLTFDDALCFVIHKHRPSKPNKGLVKLARLINRPKNLYWNTI